MPPSRPRWPPSEPRPRSRASVAIALWRVGAQTVACCPHFNGVERVVRAKPHGRTDPLEHRRPNPCTGRGGSTHRRDLCNATKVAGRISRLGRHGSSTCMINSRWIRFMAMSSSALHRMVPCKRLSDASIPAIDFSRQCSLDGKSLRPTGSDKSSTMLCHAKAAGQPHACATPSTAGQVPAGLPAKPGPGKTWTSQARPRLPQAHQQQLCSQELSVMSKVLIGHFDEANSVSKEIGSDSPRLRH